MPMNKTLIMTYGLSETQMEILRKEFPSEYIKDVTDCFTDLIAIPAAAVVVNPDTLADDEKSAFNEVFEHDFNTCISVLGSWDDMQFVHVAEDDYVNMEETISAIKDRFSIPDEFSKVSQKKENVIARINAAFENDPDASYLSQIGHINSTSIPYDNLTKILEHLPELKAKEKVPYRIELNSILQAVMLAHGIVSIDDIDFVSEPDIGYEREWITSLADSISKHYENTVMKNGPVYRPIIQKISSWIEYEENKPKTKYDEDAENHDKFRSEHDLDCVLRNGNLHADTIFSLWLPLRFALVRLSGYDKIKEITGLNLEQSVPFWKALISNGNLKKLLPIKNETTRLLSELFYYGQKIENTMLLPERWLQSRGGDPYYDYMPYFLYECFKGGNFHKAFGSDEKVCEWIREENLVCFFDGAVCKENIIDLAGTGNVKRGIPDDLNYMLRSYISILQKREK